MIAGKKPIIKPSRICLELTNHCNLTCIFCDREHLKQEGMLLKDMSAELLEKILHDIEADYTSRDKLETLVLVGLGEPTLARHLKQHLETISGYSHLVRNIELTSNGVSLTEQNASLLLDSAVNHFTVSVNFFDRETYAKMMGRDKFDTVIKNVGNFLKLRRDKGNKALVRIQLFTEVGSGNRELAIMKGYFPDFASDPMVVFHLQPIYNKPSVQDNTNSLQVVKNNEVRHPCWSMYSIVYIDVEGFVYPCTIGNDCYRKKSFLNIGNVYDNELITIFNDSIIKEARSRAEVSRLPFAECKDCNLWSIMPKLFRYNSKQEVWEKKAGYEALIKFKNYVNPVIALLPYSVQNCFRGIYSSIFSSHNRKIN